MPAILPHNPIQGRKHDDSFNASTSIKVGFPFAIERYYYGQLRQSSSL
jgi:hypothetical protein